MEDNFNLQILDHYEQWLDSHHDNHMPKFIKISQGLPNFKVWLNKTPSYLGGPFSRKTPS
jgi:hypothetical protein